VSTDRRPRLYRQLFRQGEIGWALLVSQAARLPAAMIGLAIILRLAGGTGSYARAGVATAAYVAGVALAGPLLGRAADRLGWRSVLLATALMDAALLILLGLVPVEDTCFVLLTAGGVGLMLPPVAPAMRALWPKVATGSRRELLFSLDATLQETTWIVGPALVALMATFAGSSAPLVASGLLGLAGTLALVGRPVPVPGSAEPVSTHDRMGVWSMGLLTLVTVSLLFASGTGAVQVAVVAFAHLRHASGQSGLLISVWSLGSLVGGLSYGRRATASGAGGLGALLVFVGLGEALLAGSPTTAVLYVVLFIGGTGFAPVIGCLLRVVSDLAPPRAATEAFGWIASGNRIGAAAGAALGGLLVQAAGTRMVFVLAGTATALAGFTAISGRTVLQADARALRAPFTRRHLSSSPR